MTTFCPQLWDGVYLNREGDVFPCCHQNPIRIGNIHESPLAAIVNGFAALEARRQSLAGTLACYAACTLLDKSAIRPTGEETLHTPYDRLHRLHISFGEACNIRCAMCLHPLRHAKNPTVLEPSVVVRNVDVSPFEEIVIQGGEPLFVPACLEYMSYLEDVGKRYTLLTNGLLIDEHMAERLARYARTVSISINGATKRTHEAVNRGSRFERVLANIKGLRDARDRLGSDVVISGRMTLTPQNVHEIPLFMRAFREFGFDRVNFGFVKETVPGFLAEQRDLTVSIRREAAAVLRELDVKDIDLLRLHQLGLLEAASRSSEPAQEQSAVAIAEAVSSHARPIP